MDFFAAIKKKLLQKVDRNFDQRFWNRFDEEFTPKKSFPSVRVWLPLTFGFILVTVWWLPSLRKSSQPEIVVGHSEGSRVTESPQDPEILAEIEFFNEMDEFLLSATDEEWDELLEREES